MQCSAALFCIKLKWNVVHWTSIKEVLVYCSSNISFEVYRRGQEKSPPSVWSRPGHPINVSTALQFCEGKANRHIHWTAVHTISAVECTKLQQCSGVHYITAVQCTTFQHYITSVELTTCFLVKPLSCPESDHRPQEEAWSNSLS